MVLLPGIAVINTLRECLTARDEMGLIVGKPSFSSCQAMID